MGASAKKTALLQILVVRLPVRFANVLFCALAVHYFVFLLCLYVANCLLLSVFLHLAVTDGTICSWGLRAVFLSSYTAVVAGCELCLSTPKPQLIYIFCYCQCFLSFFFNQSNYASREYSRFYILILFFFCQLP